MDFVYLNNYQDFSCSFGYGSIFDQDYWQFTLCEDCLIELIKCFKFAPDGFKREQSMFSKDPENSFKIWCETGEYGGEFMTQEELNEYYNI